VVLPKAIRRLTPDRVRDDPRVRAIAVGTGVIPPRTMHSPGEAVLLADLARGRRRVVEIGVFEGSSAIVLCGALEPGAELHLIDPFGFQPSALREGAAATEWATRRVVERAARRSGGPQLHWHVDFSASVAERWTLPVDLVFIDGDHSEIGVTKDWELWHPFVVEGGMVLFHDARQSQPGGDGLPGPTAVVDRLFRGPRALPDWEIAAEVDRAVAVRCAPRAA
jgi:predicted O-methyltransferase YrrM